jgi:hypothetical protein
MKLILMLEGSGKLAEVGEMLSGCKMLSCMKENAFWSCQILGLSEVTTTTFAQQTSL